MDKQYYAYDYSFQDWIGRNFSGRHLESSNFAYTPMDNVNFSGANLKHVSFARATLTGANFSHAILRQVDFSGALLKGATFDGAVLEEVNFSQTRLQDINLTKAILRRSILVDSPKQFTKLTLSHDGQVLAGVEENQKEIWLWGAMLSKPGQILESPLTAVEQLLFHPTRRILASVYAGASVTFWDTDHLRHLRHLQLTKQPYGQPPQKGASFSPDGQFFAVPTWNWSDQPVLLLWDMKHMKEAQEIPIEGGSVFAFSPESMLLAAGRDAVSLWDIASGQKLQQFPLAGVRELTFHASGKTLFVLAEQLYQVEVSTGKLLDPRPEEYPGNRGEVINAVFSPDSSLLATSDGQGAHVWEVPSGKHVPTCVGRRITFTPDSDWLIALTGKGEASDTIQCWDIQAGQLVKTLRTSHHIDNCVVSSDKRLLVGFYGKAWTTLETINFSYYDVTEDEYHYEGDLTIFDVESGAVLWPTIAQQMRKAAIWQATISADSRWLTLISQDEYRGDLHWRWDLTNGTAEQPTTVEGEERDYLYGHRGKMREALPVSSANGLWQVRSEGHHVQIWDQEQQIVVGRTREPPNPESISPAWHDRRVQLGLADHQENWMDLLKNALDSGEMERALIEHKIAFEDRQAADHLQHSLLLRGSRQGAFVHSIKHRAFDPIHSVLAVVHQDGTLSVFHATSGHYQQIYYEPHLFK